MPPPAGFGPLRFSRGVLVGDTFYLGGQIGIDAAKKKGAGRNRGRSSGIDGKHM
jgi:enamine deaminase RidA (YjgF/YER057c/UK114 family)